MSIRANGHAFTPRGGISKDIESLTGRAYEKLMAEVQRAQASLPALTGAQVRKLKSQGQKLEPVLHLGKAGMSEPFLQSLNEVLELHELVKVRLAEFKEERKTLAPQLAEKSNSVLIQQVGHVIILYRPNSDPAKRRIHL